MKTNFILFLSTAATSASMLFIPLIAKEMGADNFMVGVIVSTYGLTTVISMYLFGWLSDNRGRLGLIRMGMLVAALTFLGQIYAANEWDLMFIRGLCGAAVGIFYSSLITYGIESGKQIGKFTSYQSLGWGIGSIVAGVIAIYYQIYLVSAAFFLACFIASLWLKPEKKKKIKTPLLPIKLIIKNKRVYIPFLLRDIGAFSIWTFFPIYLMQLGASNLWIGIMMFINVGGQFIMMQFIDKHRFGRLFKIGMILSMLTFIGYAFPTHYLQVIPLQIMIALAWSCLGVGAMGLLTVKNKEKASVIGLFSSTRGAAQIVAPLIGGTIMFYHGFTHLMGFAATMAFIGLIIRVKTPK